MACILTRRSTLTILHQLHRYRFGLIGGSGRPNHWCQIPELDRLNLSAQVQLNFSIPWEKKNGVLEYSKCQMYGRNYTAITEQIVHEELYNGNTSSIPLIECSSWNYDLSQYQSTIVSEWDLVCDKKALVSMGFTVYMLALMLCALVYGVLADRFGRKPCLIGSIIIAVVSGISMALSPNFAVFIIFRLLYSMAGFALYQSAFIMGMELVGPKWRSFNGSLIALYHSLGYATVGGVGYLIRDWRTLQWSTSLPLVLGLLYIFFIPESPRWQLSKGKTQDALKTIKKIAHHNRKLLRDDIKLQHSDEETKGNILDLFRYPSLRRKTLVVCCHWSTVTLVYYGIAYNSVTLGGNDYVNLAISGAVELPAFLIGTAALQYMGRRWTLAGCLWSCGTCLLLLLVVPPDVAWAKILLVMAGKMFITSSFIIVYVYTGELFPTVIRATGFNCGNLIGRGVGLVAPYLIDLGEINNAIPPIVMGIVSILGGLTVLFVPETHNRKLPETIEDAENFEKRTYKDERKDQSELMKINTARNED